MEPGTITMRTSRTLDELDEAFRAIYSAEDFQRILSLLSKAGNRSSRPSLLADLYLMLDRCKIPYERGRGNRYYTNLVARTPLPSKDELEDRMLLALYSRYTDYPTPEEYMTRIVDRLSDPADGWAEQTLRVRVLKQFIKYGDYLSKAGFGGRLFIQSWAKARLGKKPALEDILACVDDEIFDCLSGGTKEQKKPEGKLGLLKLADDLAGGKFRAGGATRRGLYLFAMAYGMTYHSGGPGEEIDPRTDLEKNLFQDYYANNLMRFIQDAYREHREEFEDPSGQGMNYKNFAEVTYLYYIAQDLPPQEKIRRSAEMIQAAQRAGSKQETPPQAQDGGTALFRGRFRQGGGDPSRLSEAEFLQFLLDHYHCGTDIVCQTERGPELRRVGVMQVEQEQETAFRCYQDILRELSELGISLEECNYGLWFTDVRAVQEQGLERLRRLQPGLDLENFGRFMELLKGINRFLVEGRAVSDPSAMTRTELLSAYYYYHNARYEENKTVKNMDFTRFFEHFKVGADARLTAAYYQPLSGKNIFDVAVVYSAYMYPHF